MSFSDVSAVTNFFATANEGFNTTTTAGVTAGGNSVPIASATGLTNGTVFVGVIEPGGSKEQVFTGTVDVSGLQITGVKWTKGTNVDHANGVVVVDYDTGTAFNMMSAGMRAQHKQSGAHSAVTADSVVTTGAVTVGGALSVTGGVTLPSGSTSAVALTNPYKFHVYIAAASLAVLGGAVPAFDTRLFDTGANCNITTNKGRFTAPVSGFYFFSACLAFQSSGANTGYGVSLNKNGTTAAVGNTNVQMYSSNGNDFCTVTALVQMTAGDYVEPISSYGPGSMAGTTAGSYFQGFLVSVT